jgi:hypothetical protein
MWGTLVIQSSETYARPCPPVNNLLTSSVPRAISAAVLMILGSDGMQLAREKRSMHAKVKIIQILDAVNEDVDKMLVNGIKRAGGVWSFASCPRTVDLCCE